MTAQQKLELLELNKTARGAWTKKFLASIGVPWPPRHGWRREIVRAAIAEREAGVVPARVVEMTGVVEGWFDGAMEPVNPGGHGAWGALLKVNGETVWTGKGYTGQGRHLSNNCAEYDGLAALLEASRDYAGRLVVRGDSKLVVEQINGRWRVHGGLYVPFYHTAARLWQREKDARKGDARIIWIPRDLNAECDELSKQVLVDLGVRFNLQPMDNPEFAYWLKKQADPSIKVVGGKS